MRKRLDAGQSVTVAIVEDNAGLRSSLKAILDREPTINCVGTFESGEEALEALPALRPAVVLMDINLPGKSGVECVALLSKPLPQTQFIMLTVYDDSESIFDSLAAGAGGYLLKPVQAASLVSAIRDVLAGGAPMSMSIARRVVQTFKKPAPESATDTKLGAREMEILDLLAQGFLQKEIAEKLGISYWTVQTHVGRIYEKLHVHSRAQAVARYLKM